MSLSFTFHKYNHSSNLPKNSLSIKQQKNRGISRYICQKKASFTVEAAVVVPFYVCFMVFVLYFFRILQVQAGVAQSLQYAGRRTAAECCIQKAGSSEKTIEESAVQDDQDTDFGGLKNLLKARVFFQQELKKLNCPTQYIRGGEAGISFAQSDLSDNYIELKAVYQMKFPVALLGSIQYQIVQQSKCRKWTGYQLGQDTDGDDSWLYYTEYGSVYHASRSCTHLDLSIHGTPYSTVDQNRNNSGGKYHKCEKCGDEASNRGMVYITDYGERYHSSLTCSGLKRTIYMIRRSKATDKRMCSKCGG